MSCRGCGGESLREVADELMPGAGLPPEARGARTPHATTQSGKWRMIDVPSAQRLDMLVTSWIGTPYKDNSRVRQGGVDCRNLIVALLQEWRRDEFKIDLPKMPRDAGMHDVRAGFTTVRAITPHFPCVIVRDGSLEPGDVIVVSSEGPHSSRRLGHVAMATTRKNALVHADWYGGVSLIGMGGISVLRNYRALGKNSWI